MISGIQSSHHLRSSRRVLTMVGAALCLSTGGTLAQVPTPTPPAMSDYRFEFSWVNDVVVLFEPIWLKATVTNVSDDTLPVPDLYLHGFGLNARWQDPDGLFRCDVRPVFLVDILPGQTPGFSGQLAPGETHVSFQCVSLSVHYSMANDSIHCWVNGGTAALKVAVNPRIFRSDTSTVVDTVTLPLIVTAAQGMDSEAQRLFVQARRIRRHDLKSKQVLLRLIENFPDSRLVESAYDRLLFYSQSDPSEYRRYAVALARARPQSATLIEAARWLRTYVNQEAVDELIDIVRRSSHSAPLLESSSDP